MGAKAYSNAFEGPKIGNYVICNDLEPLSKPFEVISNDFLVLPISSKVIDNEFLGLWKLLQEINNVFSALRGRKKTNHARLGAARSGCGFGGMLFGTPPLSARPPPASSHSSTRNSKLFKILKT